MDENILKQLWLNSCNDQQVEINPEKLILSISQKINNIEKSVRRRDRREIFIAACMILLFGWWLIIMPHLLSKIGAAIIIAGCVLVMIRLPLARRNNIKKDTASAINYHLMVSLQSVKRQIKLLDTVAWWYLLPFFAGAICFYYSFPVSFTSKAIYTITVAILYGYIYYINKREITKVLKPLEQNISKLLHELSEPESYN